MPKPYDDAMKKLVGGNPQDLVSWVLPEAQFGRFAMLEDILRDTPVYQEVLAEGMEKGLEAQRQTLLDIVQVRFPAIVRLAKQQTDAIKDPEVLRHLTVKISIVKTARELSITSSIRAALKMDIEMLLLLDRVTKANLLASSLFLL